MRIGGEAILEPIPSEFRRIAGLWGPPHKTDSLADNSYSIADNKESFLVGSARFPVRIHSEHSDRQKSLPPTVCHVR